MARQPTLVQLNDALLAVLDRRAQANGCSRSELIRQAVTSYLAGDREEAIDAQIVAGYQRTPEMSESAAWAEHDLRESIAEDPW